MRAPRALTGELLQKSYPQNLLCCQTIAPFRGVNSTFPTAAQIFMNEPNGFRKLIQEVAHLSQLGGVRVNNWDWRQRQLIE